MISYKNHDIMDYIIVSAFLALYDIVRKTWYHTWYHDFFHDIMKSWFFPWYHVWYHKNLIFSDFLALLSYDFDYINITILMILAMISLLIYPLISTTSYIIAPWYQIFHVIVAYVMVPARRDGAACGRHASAAPPPPASPSPTYWGRVLSWTATVLIPRMDLLQRLLRE